MKTVTSAGGNNWAYVVNLDLTSGQTYYFSVQAMNCAGLWSNPIVSQGISVVAGDYDAAPAFDAGGVSNQARTSTNYMITDTLGQFAVGSSSSANFIMEHGYWHSDITLLQAGSPGAAKWFANDSAIQLATPNSPVVVTSGSSTFADRFYAEQPDKSSGIAAQYGAAGGPELVEGDQVWLTGKIETVNDERMIQYASPTIVGHIDPLGPLFMVVPHLGGAGLNQWTPGVLAGVGLNNVGLLVKTYGGLVSYRDPRGGFFYVDNGDNLYDGAYYGIRIICDGFAGGAKLALPPYGKNIIITGISSVVMINNQPVRAIRPRRQSDIQVVN